jgi:hypothetical protein
MRPIPPHITFEVLKLCKREHNINLGRLECRAGGKVTRFLFLSQAGGRLVLQILVRPGAISNSEEQALARWVHQSSLSLARKKERSEPSQ